MPYPTLHTALFRAAALFTEKGVDSPRLSAELLLAEALGLERSELLKRCLLAPDTRLLAEEARKAEAFSVRRAGGEPVAYILGRKEFYGRNFLVTPATLIPRPETELLVEAAAAFAQGQNPSGCGVFADLGTGSGCIAVTLACMLPGWRGLAVDRSPEALTTARENARRHGVDTRLDFVRADFTLPLGRDGSLQLIAANPPYVSEAEYRELSLEVRGYEPKTALVPGAPYASATSCPPGQQRRRPEATRESPHRAALQKGEGASGLEHAAAVIQRSTAALCSAGGLIMEIGHSQGPPLLSLLHPAYWRDARILKDLAGHDRILAATRL